MGRGENSGLKLRRALVTGVWFDGGGIVRSQDNYVVQWQAAESEIIPRSGRKANHPSRRISQPAKVEAVLPTARKVTYHIDMKRVISRKLVLGIGDGAVQVDERVIYTAKDLRVGLFVSTEGF